MLELINRARANPPAEGLRLQATTDPDVLSAYSYFSVNLATVVAEFAGYPLRPPLAFNANLIASARGHSQDMALNDFQSHTGSNGSTMTGRIEGAGYTGWNALAENVYAYADSVFYGHAGFNVDWGVPSLGHRQNIMNYSAGGPVYTEIGIGIVAETLPTTDVGPLVVTEDFGRRSGQFFVVGVVYRDNDHDGFYSVGEGLAGIAVTTSQGNYAITSASGGYAIPLAATSGTIVVQAEGAALGAAQQRSISLAGANVKVDFVVVGTSDQTLTFGAAPSVNVGGSGTLSATASSGLPVTFSSLTPGVCTVTGSTVSGVTAGQCTVAANQAGNANFNAAPQVTQSFAIGKANQAALVISVTPASMLYNGTASLSASGGSGTGTVTFGVTIGPCSVVGNTLTAIGVGPCTVNATKAADSNYNEVSATLVVSIAKANQTLSFGAAPSIGVGGSGPVSATASSGLPVAFTSQTPGVCTVAGSTVTGVTTGQCTIAADQAGNANYNAAPQATQSFSIKMYQAMLTVSAAPASLLYNGTASLSTSGGSGTGAVSYSVSSGPCSVAGSTLTATGVGACTVNATKAADSNYNEVSATVVVSVGKASQTLGFGAAPSIIVGGSGTVSATASSGLPVAFTSQTPGVCTVAGSTVSGVTAGQCTVAANQAGNANYNAAPQVTQGFAIGKGNQVALAVSATPASLLYNGTASLSTSGGSGTGAVSYGVTNGPCSVAGSTLTATGVGACTVNATKAADSNYNEVSATVVVSVGKASQTLGFGAAPSIIVGGSGSVSATASSGLPVAFTSQTPGVCTVTGSTVSGVTAGQCTIAANQAGNANYNAAPQVTQGFAIGKGNQVALAVSATPASLLYNGTASLSTSGGSGTGAVSYGVTNGPCSVAGSTLTATGIGACTVNATKAADSNYNEVSATVVVSVGKASQTLGFGAAPSIIVGGSGTVSATASSGLPVAFTSQTPGVCTVTGSTVSGVTAGQCTIAANQAGNANYNAAPQVTQGFAIGKGNQVALAVSATPASLLYNGTASLSTSGGSGTGAVSYGVTNGPCSVAGSTLTATGVGACTVNATKAADSNYNEVSATVVVSVGKASQTLGFGAAPSIIVGGSGSVSATASSGLPVTFSSLTPGVCTVTGSTVSGVTAGQCTIAANQAGNANYNAAPQVTQGFAIGKGNQVALAVSATPASLLYNGTASLSTSGGSGTGAVSYGVTNGPCSVAGSTLTATGIGACTVNATKAADSNYNEVSATVVVSVGKASQTLGFGAAPSIIVGGSGPVSATASSGLPVTFSSLTPGVCTVTGSTVSGVTVGQCTIAANQAGNANYNAALQVSQSSTVLPLGSMSLNVVRVGTGSGKVASTAPGIDCGTDCSESYAAGSSVMLLATPNTGSVFRGWSDGCAGTGICLVDAAGATNLVATFDFVGEGSAYANEWVQRAYVAYYGRPADPAGLAYWASRMDREGGSLSSIIMAFGESAEFNRRYGGLSYDQLIDTIYLQSLGRMPEAAGKQWYLDQLNAGRTTLQTITLDLMGGATGLDEFTVANRLDVANHFTGKVAAGCDYGGEENGVNSLASVKSDRADVIAAKLAIESRCGP